MAKKVMATLLALTMVLGLLAGCAGDTAGNNAGDNVNSAGNTDNTGNAGGDSGTAAGPVTFHYALSEEPNWMDPTLGSGEATSTIFNALFEGLVTADAEGNIIPAGAESWTISDDGLVYTFKLRQDAKWSDGQPVTANDYVYALQRVLDPETASMYSWFVQMFIKNSTAYSEGTVGPEELGIKAVDDYTLEYTLEHPATFFMQALLITIWLPVRQDAVESDPDRWAFNPDTCISNGPFRLKEFVTGSHMTLVKNEHYWGTDEVQIDEVKYTFMKGSTAALAAFRAGDLDGFSKVPTSDLIDLLTTDDRLHVFDRLSFNFLRLNVETKGLDDARVRRAINLGIDRQAYMDGLGSGLTNAVALGAVPEGMMLDGKDFREVSGTNGLSAEANLEEARALLEEAGYPGGEGLPVYRIHCASGSKESAEVLQEMLKVNLGIESEVYPVDDKLNWEMITRKEYDISFGGWGGDYTHPMTFLNLFTSTAFDNCTGWSNPEYDQLIADATIETDEAKQLEMLVRAEQILMEESPIIPLSIPTTTMMMQDFITGWYFSPFGVLYIRDAKIARPAE